MAKHSAHSFTGTGHAEGSPLTPAAARAQLLAALGCMHGRGWLWPLLHLTMCCARRRYLVDSFLAVQARAQAQGSGPNRSAIDIAAAALLQAAAKSRAMRGSEPAGSMAGAAGSAGPSEEGAAASGAEEEVGQDAYITGADRAGRAGGSSAGAGLEAAARRALSVGMGVGDVARGMQRGMLPRVLLEAARVGNTGAQVVVAQLHEVSQPASQPGMHHL